MCVCVCVCVWCPLDANVWMSVSVSVYVYVSVSVFAGSVCMGIYMGMYVCIGAIEQQQRPNPPLW